MSVKRTIEERTGIFFITFTCYKWINLFEIVDGYDLVYNWFDLLIKKGHHVVGYVIMPNHLHAIIALNESPQTINMVLSNAKRFMAYEMIKRLKQQHKERLLAKLNYWVSERERAKGQIHKAFEESSDIKLCYSRGFLEQKLNYIHMNPVSKKWSLVDNPVDYIHSSMRFYEEYHEGIKSKLTPYMVFF